MKTYEFTDCEQVLLLDLLTQLLSDLDSAEYASKPVLPPSKTIDLKEIDIKVLRSLLFKIHVYIE